MMTKLARRVFLQLTAGALTTLVIPPSTWALDYPTRPITIIEPFGVSSVPDILVRIIAPRLSQILGQPVIVENIVGAGGMIGVSRVARAAPDGYHLAIASVSTQAYSQTLYKMPLYNAETDFAPITLLSEQPLMLVTSNNLPVKNLQEFVAYTRANQAKMQFGSLAGTGSANHVVCVLFNDTIGVHVQHVPYRPPSSTAYQDLISGRIDYVCPVASGDAKAHIESGQFRGIAVFSKHRSPIMPSVPTADEQGLKDFEGKIWNAFFAPKRTPVEIIHKLHDAIVKAVDDPDVRTRIENYGAELVGADRRSPEYLQVFVESEIKKWAAPIRTSGAAEQ
jgi:tripartite-type tricarboxylate transporter receptor subunit TctC